MILIMMVEVFILVHLFFIDLLTNIWCPVSWSWVLFWTRVRNIWFSVLGQRFYGSSFKKEVKFWGSIIGAKGVWGRFFAILKFYDLILLWVIIIVFYTWVVCVIAVGVIITFYYMINIVVKNNRIWVS
jgi:hypothetical protein